MASLAGFCEALPLQSLICGVWMSRLGKFARIVWGGGEGWLNGITCLLKVRSTFEESFERSRHWEPLLSVKYITKPPCNKMKKRISFVGACLCFWLFSVITRAYLSGTFFLLPAKLLLFAVKTLKNFGPIIIVGVFTDPQQQFYL